MGQQMSRSKYYPPKGEESKYYRNEGFSTQKFSFGFGFVRAPR